MKTAIAPPDDGHAPLPSPVTPDVFNQSNNFRARSGIISVVQFKQDSHIRDNSRNTFF